jgi:hypothetical protein
MAFGGLHAGIHISIFRTGVIVMALISPFQKLIQPMFLKEQAERCRSLAEKADPFTKERLLGLAQKYDERYAAQTGKHPANNDGV